MVNNLIEAKIFPALFIGHGSPMNCIDVNSYTDFLKIYQAQLPVPKAILVISAHWQSKGATLVSSSDFPRQINDFYGFPKELYELKYSCRGSSELAQQIAELDASIQLSDNWGIDHAAWAVLIHLYPEANIPVLELSLDMTQSPKYHVELARKLAVLRTQNVLILGSGNLIHNLGDFSWNTNAQPFPWAEETDEQFKELILGNKLDQLLDYKSYIKNAQRAIPTLDHYLPALYVLALRQENEAITMIHESIQNGSIAMRSFRIG